MARTSLWIGIDAGADEMSLCAKDDEGAVVFQHSCVTKAKVVHELLRRAKRRIQASKDGKRTFEVSV